MHFSSYLIILLVFRRINEHVGEAAGKHLTSQTHHVASS